MTKRVVSLMSVAAVAAMVMLAGCSSGPGAAPADEPMDEPAAEDHAAALAGTWMSEALDRMVPLNAMDPMNLTAVETTVTVTIAAGDMANTGTFRIMSADTVAATPVSGISVNGTITVDASEIVVTVTGVLPEEAADVYPALAAAPQTLTYMLSDDGNMLTVGSPLLGVLLGPMHTPLELTKQMESS